VLLSRVIDGVLRADGARLLAGLIRLAGNIDDAEDALQEACARALLSWRGQLPDTPAAWLNTVARRIVLDGLRRRRDASGDGIDELPDDAAAAVDDVEAASAADDSHVGDDRLRLLFTCCHPALAPEARCALALKTLGGLGTRQIARAFLESEATVAQRLVRAKRKIREAGIAYRVPARSELPGRLDTVLSVLYLIFNEGYVATEADALVRPDLALEAIRLSRLVVVLLPGQAEAMGLLALMLLVDARRAARICANGDLVPLEEQDRSSWDAAAIAEGTALLDRAMALREPGPYQLQAAVAALHGAATDAASTDWRQIALLYRALLDRQPTPLIELNAAVAHGMRAGPAAGLRWLDQIEASGRLAGLHLLHAARADLLRRLGRNPEAADAYRLALQTVRNLVERRYLQQRLTAVLS
jgi:RNA polymerase sigma-70 factor (ECF subfamily)